MFAVRFQPSFKYETTNSGMKVHHALPTLPRPLTPVTVPSGTYIPSPVFTLNPLSPSFQLNSTGAIKVLIMPDASTFTGPPAANMPTGIAQAALYVAPRKVQPGTQTKA